MPIIDRNGNGKRRSMFLFCFVFFLFSFFLASYLGIRVARLENENTAHSLSLYEFGCIKFPGPRIHNIKVSYYGGVALRNLRLWIRYWKQLLPIRTTATSSSIASAATTTASATSTASSTTTKTTGLRAIAFHIVNIAVFAISIFFPLRAMFAVVFANCLEERYNNTVYVIGFDRQFDLVLRYLYSSLLYVQPALLLV